MINWGKAILRLVGSKAARSEASRQENVSGAEPMAAPQSSGHLQPQSGHPHGAHSRTAECAICFCEHPADGMLGATSASEGPSNAVPRCGHLFCTDCMYQYMCSCIDDIRYPLRCPTYGCHELLQHQDVLRLLQDSPTHMERYMQLDVENSIHPSQRTYCPYKDCSVLLIRPGQDEEEGPTLCPECERTLCAKCLVVGWHQGYNCKQFQALPAHLRSAEDAALLQLSAAQRWRKCPSCNHVVERVHGCNHVRCRCGTGFCYACGLKYVSSTPTANNQHGQPSCRCALFTVPEEDEPDAPAVPVDGLPRPGDLLYGIAPAVAARVALPGDVVLTHRVQPMGRLVRSERRLSWKRCHHTPSAQDCPYGPDRCWHWHDEDYEQVDALGLRRTPEHH